MTTDPENRLSDNKTVSTPPNNDTRTDLVPSSLPRRVLSIQSHVVSGYVGNKAAVFPMQLWGWDVDVINSVQFSHHTGYPTPVQGQILSGNDVQTLWKGLIDSDLVQNTVSHLLTGYIGSESFLKAVLEVWLQLKQLNPTACYVCDPVLGDHGQFYVPPELVQVYRHHVIPQASVVTPNLFELEQLTGHTVTSLPDAIAACAVLHNLGPPLVILTSWVHENTVTVVASQRHNSRTTQVWKIQCPWLPGHFTGTGDLTAALILIHHANHPPPRVLELVVNTLYAILERSSVPEGASIKDRELQLIASKDLLEHPPERFVAELIE